MPPGLRAAAERYSRRGWGCCRPSRTSPRTTGSGRWPPSSSGWTARPGRRGARLERGDRRDRRRPSRRADPVREHRPLEGEGRCPGGAEPDRGTTASRGSSSTPACRRSIPDDRQPMRSTRRSPRRGCRLSSTRARAESGMGQRGGGGIRLKYSNPLYLDDVAVDFPDMPIVLAHPSFPGRTRRSPSPCTSRRCTSTCPAGRRSTSRRNSCSTRTPCCKEKVLFGSDFPFITPGTVAGRLRAGGIPRRGQAADPQGERRAAARAATRLNQRWVCAPLIARGRSTGRA